MSCMFRKVIKERLVHSFRYFSCTTDKLKKKPILYGDEASPPVRFVRMTAAFLNIELNFHHIDLFKEENNSEFYKTINPLQKVPAMKVEDQVLCDSHAIALYLCNQDQGDNNLYPTDSMMKARVDEMLFFNSSALFQLDSRIFTEFFAGEWPISHEKIEKWNFLLNFLEKRLNQSTWLAGDKMLLCDISCAATVSSCRLLVPSLENHKKVNEWLKKLEDFPCFEINARGLLRLKNFVDGVKFNK